MKHKWTAAEEALLIERYPNMRTDLLAKQMGMTYRQVSNKAASLGLKKTAEFLASPESGRINGIPGAQCRFKKGQAPWNKGKQWDSGGRSHETRFKGGERRGAAAHNYRPLGSERELDGYLLRKVSETGVRYQDWRPVHVLAWEAEHGSVPKGYAVVFKDGNKRNFALDNLELVTRAELMRRNSYHNNYPKEVAQLIQLLGAVNRQINKRDGNRHGK